VPNVDDLPDFYGKLIDTQGRILDTSGEPLEGFVVAIREMLNRKSGKRYRMVPNMEKGKRLAKTALLCRDVVHALGGTTRIDVDDTLGTANIQIRAKSIEVSDVRAFVAAIDGAHVVSVFKHTDGTVALDVGFNGIYTREEIE